MLRKIYRELVEIKKELHAIRKSVESANKTITINTFTTQKDESVE